MKVKHKWIKGYEGSYSVGTNGGIMSHSRIDKSGRAIRSRILKTSNHKLGYPQVVLTTTDGVRKNHLVHVLVATAHIPNPHNLPVVKHLDHDPTNPDVSNLMWDTQQQNTEDSIAKEYVFKSPTNKVVRIHNLAKFCRENNLTERAMYSVASGKSASHYGWTL